MQGTGYCQCGCGERTEQRFIRGHNRRLSRFDYLAALQANVDRNENGCWIWQASINASGYGRWKHRQINTRLAHRISYELIVGPVPEGMELDHLCRVRACVNPAHLEPVDHATNMRRGELAMRTHCANGHERTLENTYIGHDGHKACRPCTAAYQRRYQAKKRQAA